MEEEAENRKKAEEIMKEAKLQTERKVEEYRNNREKYMQDIRNDEYKNCITTTERSEVAEKAKVVQLSPKDSKDKQRTDAFIKDFSHRQQNRRKVRPAMKTTAMIMTMKQKE